MLLLAPAVRAAAYTKPIAAAASSASTILNIGHAQSPAIAATGANASG